jgi:hypothetical protein
MPNHPLGALAAAKAFVGSTDHTADSRSEPKRGSSRKARRRRPARAVRTATDAGSLDAPDCIYLAEHFVPGVDAQRVDAHVSRLVKATEGARRGGVDVLFLGSAGLPGDESLLSLFSARTVDDVAQTIELAEVSVDRIVPVLWRAGVLEMRSRGEA